MTARTLNRRAFWRAMITRTTFADARARLLALGEAPTVNRRRTPLERLHATHGTISK